MIGADGGGSIVRKCAGIPFEGFTYPECFALISTPYDLGRHGFTDTAYISHPVEWCAVFRLPDLAPPGLWRFLYGCRPDESEEESLAEDNVEKPTAGRRSEAGPLRDQAQDHLSGASKGRGDLSCRPSAAGRRFGAS